MKIFDATLTTLERALDVRLARQAVLAGNVANADTPGFTPKELDFQAAMAAAAGPEGTPAAPERFVADDAGAAPGLDGNAVDLDRTMGAIAENAIQYGTAAKAAAKKLAILRYAASDGTA